MTRRLMVPSLGGASALVLHRPHTTVQALHRQLAAIGLTVSEAWPDAGPGILGHDFIFLDADLCHDAQFPWAPGAAPMPLIALIGSEAPGRVEWVLSIGADAQLLKPVGGNGVYATLLIARAGFEARQRQASEIQELRRRLGDRETVVKAVLLLVAAGRSETDAYDHLRQTAMKDKRTIEDAAHSVIARLAGGRDATSTRG